jgi:hypothetical protein
VIEVRWTGNNTRDIGRLLAEHMARAEPDGGRLHLVGMGLNTHICVGDTVMVEGDRLGIKRAKSLPTIDPYVTWEGDNLLEIDDFLKLYGVRLEVMSDRLSIYAGRELMASMGRGDRVTKKLGSSQAHIEISRAGEHHRV